MTHRYSVDRTPSNIFPIPTSLPLEQLPRYFWHWNPAASKASWNSRASAVSRPRHKDVFSMTNSDPGGDSRKQRRARSSISWGPTSTVLLRSLRNLENKVTTSHYKFLRRIQNSKCFCFMRFMTLILSTWFNLSRTVSQACCHVWRHLRQFANICVPFRLPWHPLTRPMLSNASIIPYLEVDGNIGNQSECLGHFFLKNWL